LPTADRRPRADAERNRARVLDTARSLFAERGDDVQIPEIARAAGVGVGTVSRHFPTRQDLVEAAAEQRFAQILAYARKDRRRRPELGGGLERYLRHVAGILTKDRGLSAAIEASRGAPGSPPQGETLTQLEEAIQVLIDDARAAGTIRPDLTVKDVYMIVGSLSAVISTGSGDWRRFLALILDGLRPS
jgi:AcrR family transcriptional regulator